MMPQSNYCAAREKALSLAKNGSGQASLLAHPSPSHKCVKVFETSTLRLDFGVLSLVLKREVRHEAGLLFSESIVSRVSRAGTI
jgi:hypothetical protein